MKSTLDGLSSQDLHSLKSSIDEAAIVAITDQNGTITYVNQKFCQISQYSQSELLGENHRIINSGYHSGEFFAALWKTIREGKTWEGEIRNRAKDGSVYWVHTTIVPFLDDEGVPLKYVSIRYDITKRKSFEEQLTVYARKLETSNRELQDFASIAAHDLQEPLRKIQSFSDRLVTKIKDQLSPEALDYLQRIQNSAGRMQTLINDLLSYSRVTTKAQPFSRVSLDQILSQVVSDLELRIEQTKASVRWENLPTLDSDPTQMRQLFQNLIGNALKFTAKDQVAQVKISGRVFEDPSDKGAHQRICQILVEDNGIGFDEKYLDRIFTLFQRLHGRQEYEGTGIGLAICRKIVDRHGGTLTARSEPGKGATFIISLPQQQNSGEIS